MQMASPPKTAPPPVDNGHDAYQPMPYISPPGSSSAFPDLRSVHPKTPFPGGMRKRWKDDSNDIFEWDYQHGQFERYDSRGRHRGQFDPETGEQTKDADPNKTVER
jgi:Cytotoxic